MKNTFLVIKGNFTQRQFDTLGRIWNELQTEQGIEGKTCPLFQLAGSEGDLGYMTIDFENNEIKTGSVFGNPSELATKEDLLEKLGKVLNEIPQK